MQLSLRYCWLLVSALICCGGTQANTDYPLAKSIKPGWNGSIEVGALATFGATDTSAVSADADFTYKIQDFEHELGLTLYRSDSESIVAVTAGNNAAGDVLQQRITTVTNNRRYLYLQTRKFFSSRFYTFGMLDVERNKPADIELSSRQILGLGYRLYHADSDYVSAAFGMGRKSFRQTSARKDDNAIAYIALRFDRKINQAVTFELALNSDFGANNRFSEFNSALKWKLNQSVTLKLNYEARFNSNIANPLNTFSDGFEGAVSASIEMQVF